MRPEYINQEILDTFIKGAIHEDIGDGDHTSIASIDSVAKSKAELIIKSDGIIAGVELAEIILNRINSELEIRSDIQDGDTVEAGQKGFTITGNTRSILQAERLILNCMQRMSGIATKTNKIVQMLKGSKAKVLDTRKTTPNFRMAEKWAVYIGGGTNHRFGLYDMILLKDNHIDFAGGIPRAIQRTREYLSKTGLDLKIEIETRSLAEVEEVLSIGGIDIIMLDNMVPSMMKEAVGLINGKYQTEASGGISEVNIAEVAETGIDFISIGALTHSYHSLDISLKAVH